MNSVNELVFDQRMKVRPPWEDWILYETVARNLMKPENERFADDMKRVRDAGIRNLGEKGATELIGALAIFLTQVPEQMVEAVECARLRRTEEVR